MYLNKAIIYGNLTRDPERRSLPSGASVVNFSVATSRVWKDKSGVKQEDTQYHNIVAFAQLADLISQYLHKGSGVLVEGRMQTRSWDSPEGKKYRTEIVADAIQFGPKREGGATTGSYESKATSTSQPAEQPSAPLDTIQYPEEDINPDDIPF
ncbi:MAG: Single-stranded DNA-binding protein [Parcubacteria group bacterium GW2011_GWC1_43_11b]|uniref:Single-stranded DNA-binding protein n=2 Tax=Candidatus Vogeliibacteriota TaxID=1817922 RepID=A0A1G2QET0_9BACT|nr:MAG: Single-stranded DNA-binding protein [Parcubacteria group bacterium GW2011_GWB1_42_9]KKS88153.1 MAG: Single-stranded DNA-binding protein [Parcubacteria group bacterium GW2011_GWC1_43_11b]KKT09152.1 MAG: Single-stranded DNA-binding protein [Parcubacteria group bacterium GW2011_GWA1_43_21]OHA58732.1 MAG: single-stranded DNA-binding protein [Candidatus Vogelbacteria bacterium RIFOXYD1_FULL_42_15]OHA59090.1 MAG: single-stranded DNA-binding protein [Candidatus Vogelbacteria bacterium RIFOXYB1